MFQIVFAEGQDKRLKIAHFRLDNRIDQEQICHPILLAHLGQPTIVWRGQPRHEPRSAESAPTRQSWTQRAYLIFVIFFTLAKFLENKIYTEKRQFFALNV